METHMLRARARRAISALVLAYRRHRAAKKRTGANRVLRHLPAWMAATYLLLLCFPQVLFAHELPYRNLIIYSREPLDKSIYDVLDRVESRLAASEIDGDRSEEHTS